MKDAKGRGRLGGETPRAVIDYIKSISPHSIVEDPTPQFLSSPTSKNLRCSLCQNVAFPPVELSCEHIACSDCCCRAIQATYSLNSPCCSDHTLNSQTVRPPSSLLTALLNDQLVKCVKGCGGQGCGNYRSKVIKYNYNYLKFLLLNYNFNYQLHL